MAKHQYWQRPWSAMPAALLAAAALSALLAGCGGGGGGNSTAATSSTSPSTLPLEPGAPALSGNTALDGFNWINYRRALLGLSVLARNSQVDAAAQGHSNYLRLNNTVSHEQTAGAPGFTGVDLTARLKNAGYVLTNPGYAVGEVISATSNTSGFYQAEELITAIYHRFVMFEPVFKEIGTGATSVSGGYTYFTADLTATNGLGPGIGAGKLVTYPANNQVNVPTSFASDTESPDPVPNQNEVGFPISVHADGGRAGGVVVRSFTVTPRGGGALDTRLLSGATDANTTENAAAIIPLAPLRAATTYDVSFDGTVAGTVVTRAWSFTTR